MTYFGKHQIQAADESGDRIDLISNDVGNLIAGDFALEVARGKISGYSSPILAASNVDLDIGTETIWRHDGLWVPMATARTMSIVSDNANDTSAGTGATTVLVIGLDAAGAVQTEVVVMNGTTPVVTTGTWSGINPSLVIAAGSSTFNEGNITFTSTTDNEVQTVIGAEDSLSNALIYHVPLGSTFYLKQLRASLFKGSGADAIVIVNGYVSKS